MSSPSVVFHRELDRAALAIAPAGGFDSGMPRSGDFPQQIDFGRVEEIGGEKETIFIEAAD